MTRKEEDLIDVRDVEGSTDRYGNMCLKIGNGYVLYINQKGTHIISKKIPAFRYVNVRRCKNGEEAKKIFSSLESQVGIVTKVDTKVTVDKEKLLNNQLSPKDLESLELRD